MMSSRSELPVLRRAALEIFYTALRSVDAEQAVRRSVHLDGSRITLFDTAYELKSHGARVYSVAIGKAARAMASALDEVLGSRLTRGIVAAPSETEKRVGALVRQLVEVGQVSEDEARTRMFRSVIRQAVERGHESDPVSLPPISSRWKVFEGGHPLPNGESLRAARAAIDLVRRANEERAILIFLISGGGSAAFELPQDAAITLEDLRQTNRVLVSCGATIAEINSVRRAVSAVKGGRLSALAPGALQISLIVSDTNTGEESLVASGPTFPAPKDAPDPLQTLARYQLEKRLPATVLQVVKEAARDNIRIKDYGRHYLLLDNRSAIDSAAEAARSRGFTVEIAQDIVEQPIQEGCAELLSRLRAGAGKSGASVFCLISGGEFACPVRGDGTGGRNAETVLRCAIEIEEESSRTVMSADTHTVILSAGTDGIDGNSPAAGALADETTTERGRALGLNGRGSLERSDAHTFFNALGDAINTGPTGTNTRDLRIMIRGRQS